jgi:hypothetical protein
MGRTKMEERMRARTNWTLLGAAWIAALSIPLTATAADLDRDGVWDRSDNCAATANPGQADGDLDGLGDACDVDYNNDGRSDDVDTSLFTESFNSAVGDALYQSIFDHNGDGVVNGADFAAQASLRAKGA